MDTVTTVKAILRDALNLGQRADALDTRSPLLGGLPEFDSMAVVTVVTMLEDRFGITIEDDELTADLFSTLGSLCAFIDGRARV